MFPCHYLPSFWNYHYATSAFSLAHNHLPSFKESFTRNRIMLPKPGHDVHPLLSAFIHSFIRSSFGATPWHMEFPGQGSNPSHNCNLRCSCGNPLCWAGDWTWVLALQRHHRSHWATVGTPSAIIYFRTTFVEEGYRCSGEHRCRINAAASLTL